MTDALNYQMFTPDQVAKILQLSTATIYDLIDRGEIIAKKIGKVYRIPANSVSFAITGLDFDLYQAQKEDFKSILETESQLTKARENL